MNPWWSTSPGVAVLMAGLITVMVVATLAVSSLLGTIA